MTGGKKGNGVDDYLKELEAVNTAAAMCPSLGAPCHRPSRDGDHALDGVVKFARPCRNCCKTLDVRSTHATRRLDRALADLSIFTCYGIFRYQDQYSARLYQTINISGGGRFGNIQNKASG